MFCRAASPRSPRSDQAVQYRSPSRELRGHSSGTAPKPASACGSQQLWGSVGRGGSLVRSCKHSPKTEANEKPLGDNGTGTRQRGQDRAVLRCLFRCEDEAPTCCTDPEAAGSATHLDVILQPYLCAAQPACVLSSCQAGDTKGLSAISC